MHDALGYTHRLDRLCSNPIMDASSGNTYSSSLRAGQVRVKMYIALLHNADADLFFFCTQQLNGAFGCCSLSGNSAM